jgi:hypothetical protein
MTARNKVFAVIISFLFVFSVAGLSYSAEKTVTKKTAAKIMSVTGEVIAVDAASMTLTVKSDKEEISFNTTASTVVKAGKKKKALTDINTDDKVTVTYSRKDDKNIAKSVLIKSEKAIISKSEAQTLLKDLAPDLKVLEIRPAPVKELWEIAVQVGERKGLLYLDSSKKHFFQGAIIDLKTKANLTQDRMSELNKIDVSTIPLDDAIVMGDNKAKYKIIVFDDPE